MKIKRPTTKQRKAADKAVREARLKIKQARNLIIIAQETIVAKVEPVRCECIHSGDEPIQKPKNKRKIKTAPYFYESPKGMTQFARYSEKKSKRPKSFGPMVRPEKYSRREILIRSR